MVTSKAVWARVDRPAGIVTFTKPQDANDVLNEWSDNVHKVLELTEKLGHLIQKVLEFLKAEYD
jgi:26S proteasome regulatory subunit N5